MDLKNYMKTHDVTPMDLAHKAKIGLASVYRLLAGGKALKTLSKKISDATDGKVTMEELMYGSGGTHKQYSNRTD